MITKMTQDNAAKYTRLFSQASDVITNLRRLEGITNPEVTIDGLEAYYEYMADLASIDNSDIVANFMRIPADEDIFEIDTDARKITVPSTTFGKNGIGVIGDTLAEVLYFKVPRYFDTMDLNNALINIVWKNANNVQGMTRAVFQTVVEGEDEDDTVTIDGVTYTNEYLVFGWPLSKDVTAKAGNVQFMVSFFLEDAQLQTDGTYVNEKSYALNTQLATVSVKTSLTYDITDSTEDLKTLVKSRVANSFAAKKPNITTNLPTTDNLYGYAEGETITAETPLDGGMELQVEASSSDLVEYKQVFPTATEFEAGKSTSYETVSGKIQAVVHSIYYTEDHNEATGTYSTTEKYYVKGRVLSDPVITYRWFKDNDELIGFTKDHLYIGPKKKIITPASVDDEGNEVAAVVDFDKDADGNFIYVIGDDAYSTHTVTDVTGVYYALILNAVEVALPGGKGTQIMTASRVSTSCTIASPIAFTIDSIDAKSNFGMPVAGQSRNAFYVDADGAALTLKVSDVIGDHRYTVEKATLSDEGEITKWTEVSGIAFTEHDSTGVAKTSKDYANNTELSVSFAVADPGIYRLKLVNHLNTEDAAEVYSNEIRATKTISFVNANPTYQYIDTTGTAPETKAIPASGLVVNTPITAYMPLNVDEYDNIEYTWMKHTVATNDDETAPGDDAHNASYTPTEGGRYHCDITATLNGKSITYKMNPDEYLLYTALIND